MTDVSSHFALKVCWDIIFESIQNRCVLLRVSNKVQNIDLTGYFDGAADDCQNKIYYSTGGNITEKLMKLDSLSCLSQVFEEQVSNPIFFVFDNWLFRHYLVRLTSFERRQCSQYLNLAHHAESLFKFCNFLARYLNKILQRNLSKQRIRQQIQDVSHFLRSPQGEQESKANRSPRRTGEISVLSLSFRGTRRSVAEDGCRSWRICL